MGISGSGTILSSPEPKSSGKRVVWAVVIILLLAILLGVYFWRQEPQPVQKVQPPAAPAVAPAPPPPAPIKDTVHFAFDKSALSAEEKAKVKAFGEKVSGKAGQITIEGYTCSLGSDWYNERLSRRRAERVAKLLAAPSSGAVKVQGYGKTKPVADNSSGEGRAANRRAEVVFLPAP